MFQTISRQCLAANTQVFVASGANKESGTAAIEFAFVLPVFLFMMYGMVVYAYMFVLQESLVFAAQASAEATVKVNPAQEDYEAALDAVAKSTASQILGYLPEDQKQRVLGGDAEKVTVTPDTANGTIEVELTFEFEGLFPVLSLPGLGDVPPMPANLTARAVAAI